MALIALTTADAIEVFDSVVPRQITALAKVAITAGAAIRLDTDGKWLLAIATAAGTATGVYIAAYTVPIGMPVTGFKSAKFDGYAVSALDFGVAVYLSDTAGSLGDAAGTVSLVVGRIVPGMSEPNSATPKKLVAIDIA